MRVTSLYCLQCDKVVKVECHLVFKPRAKIEFLQKNPRMMGMFLGNVLFMPADDDPCRVGNHLMIARQSEHIVDPLKGHSVLTVTY